jgi:VanZ family protein
MGVLVLAFYSLSPPAVKEAAGGNSLPGQANHAVAYLVIAAALRWAYPRSSPWRTLLLLTVYGCVLELLQTFVPGRSPKIIDALSSGVGAAMGAAVGRPLLDLAIRWTKQDRVRLRDEGG